MSSYSNFNLTKATIDDADTISLLESNSFPEDEAASLDTIILRLSVASDFFYKLVDTTDSNAAIVGFINGTCIKGQRITHESMYGHVNTDFDTLVIHSVTIDSAYRNKGIGRYMMNRYVSVITTQYKDLSIRLLCKEKLLHWYTSMSFVSLGPSSVHHGQETWFELVYKKEDAEEIV